MEIEPLNDVYFVGVDVGTAGVRGGLYSLLCQKFLKIAVENITVHKSTISVNDGERDRYDLEIVSQSSSEIWNAVCKVVNKVVTDVQPKKIKGIGFDATCSLVIIGPDNKALAVDGDDLDVIMWMDHRAKNEADFINKELTENNHQALKFVGGQVSLEMEIPKLLWLKRHRPEIFKNASKFMDLCDFLTWKATGSSARSMCSVVCKWLYQVDPTNPRLHGWDKYLLKTINLEELGENNFEKIGSEILVPGASVQNGVSQSAANELGLRTGMPVAAALIDAHAGGLALAFCSNPESGFSTDPFKRLGLVCGTSTCFMICSEKPAFVPGVWGPYWSAMVPESWLSEAGQSAAGQFLDHIVQTHPYYITTLRENTEGKMSACYKLLNQRVEAISKERNLPYLGRLSDHLHVFPDFHGNRSPLSNPEMKGMIMGLTLDGHSEFSLLKLYVASIQALAYETRWIMQCLTKGGVEIADVAICGGLANNDMFVQTLADVIGKPVLIPEIQESVMLGSAILVAAASGHFQNIRDAALAMAGESRLVKPNSSIVEYHDNRFKVFREMADFQLIFI